MAAKPTMLTAEGLKNLEEELAELQNVKRKEIAEKIKVARSYGDLSENSEYDDAKNEQAIMEARIATIESILKTAQIIDESETSNDKVHLTSVVTIEMVGTDRQMTYKIVGSGSNETNPAQGKISDESPVGKALMDRCVGDVVEVETPGGVNSRISLQRVFNSSLFNFFKSSGDSILFKIFSITNAPLMLFATFKNTHYFSNRKND